jgi:hypothetical protein
MGWDGSIKGKQTYGWVGFAADVSVYAIKWSKVDFTAFFLCYEHARARFSSQGMQAKKKFASFVKAHGAHTTCLH